MAGPHDEMVHRLADGGIILDTDRVIPFLGKHGDRIYHWVLESDGELSVARLGSAAIVRVIGLAAAAFLVPYTILTYWTWRPAQVAILVLVGVAFLALAVILPLRRSRSRARGANLVRLGGSVQRFDAWMGANYLTVSAGLLAAVMFAPAWFVRDGFEHLGDGFGAPLPFLTFQVARVFTFDTIEIAGWDWSAAEPGSGLSLATTIALNILIGIGVLTLVLHAVRESSARAETVVGDTFEVYRLLRHEPFLGGKWVVVHGFARETKERAITGFEFVKAYENGLIPTSESPEYGDPQL